SVIVASPNTSGSSSKSWSARTVNGGTVSITSGPGLVLGTVVTETPGPVAAAGSDTGGTAPAIASRPRLSTVPVGAPSTPRIRCTSRPLSPSTRTQVTSSAARTIAGSRVVRVSDVRPRGVNF